MRKHQPFLLFIFQLIAFSVVAQVKWTNVDSLYQPLPSSVHIYFTNQPIDTGSFRAYYLIADLKDKKLDFSADTTRDRRLTPLKFYEKNDKALLVANCTYFSFETNRSLSVVIKEGELVAFNQHSIAGKGKDTLTYRHSFSSAIGISKKRSPDIAWLFSDSALKYAYAYQNPIPFSKDSSGHFGIDDARKTILQSTPPDKKAKLDFGPWKMKTAVGGGPVLLQHGEIQITDNAEQRFTGKAFYVKHPRTAMGYTREGKLIILVIEGRNKNAGGATLTQEAQIFKDLGCWEAINLDGGGSSCMLVNGKETIKVSDATGQRPVPAVFIIKRK